MRMKLIILFIFLIFPSVLFANPFLVCDPQAGVTHYKLTGPSWVPLTVPAQPDGSIRMDVSSASVGQNSLTLAACKNDEIWGELCSASIPFVFTRPSGAAPPANLRLVP